MGDPEERFGEDALRLLRAVRFAARLGFANVRCLCMVPIDVIEMALPTAEKYNVRIGKEIHAPLPIKRSPTNAWVDPLLDYHMAEQIMDLSDRTGSKYVGLVPDMGIFQHSPTRVSIAYRKRHSNIPEAVDFVVENRFNYNMDEMLAKVQEKYPGSDLTNPMFVQGLMRTQGSADPEDLREIAPYIVSIHGKFYEMTEIEGEPGHYEDKSIDYVNPMRILKECGFEGYIDSEYEGQRDQQDMGFENLPNEVEEVRRHHEMLARLGG